jgi:outer membrane immunogenic protein
MDSIMKKALFAGVSLSTLTLLGAAHAADMGRPVYKATPAAPVPFSWTGFYFGGNIGGARRSSQIADAPSSVAFGWLPSPVDSDKTGLIGGLQGGYNWQAGNLVLGIEGDISFASLKSSVSNISLSGADTFSANMNTLGTVRGRLGWAVDRVLFYGTGGVAFANIKNEINSPVFAPTGPSSNRTGWTAGGGIEYAVTGNWTVRAEYLHVGFSDKTAVDPTGYAFAFKNSADIGRVGVNYKF